MLSNHFERDDVGRRVGERTQQIPMHAADDLTWSTEMAANAQSWADRGENYY